MFSRYLNTHFTKLGPSAANALLKAKEPNIVCAAIRALSKLDIEHLCIYLPQLMQDRNGKVRMTATRAFMSIDRDSIKSLLSSMMASAKTQQRTQGFSATKPAPRVVVPDNLLFPAELFED